MSVGLFSWLGAKAGQANGFWSDPGPDVISAVVLHLGLEEMSERPSCGPVDDFLVDDLQERERQCNVFVPIQEASY